MSGLIMENETEGTI